jgi:hypothetical protein
VDAHVTQTSSAVLEAEAFGVSSVVCSVEGPDLYRPQVRSGTVVYADSAELLRETLDRQCARRVPVERMAADGARKLAAGHESLLALMGGRTET